MKLFLVNSEKNGGTVQKYVVFFHGVGWIRVA
jgi:hypothetical protein